MIYVLKFCWMAISRLIISLLLPTHCTAVLNGKSDAISCTVWEFCRHICILGRKKYLELIPKVRFPNIRLVFLQKTRLYKHYVTRRISSRFSFCFSITSITSSMGLEPDASCKSLAQTEWIIVVTGKPESKPYHYEK